MLYPYVRPQDTITQILQQTAARAESRRNPIIIGPQYNLYLNDGRDLDSAKLTFNVAGATDNPYQTGSGVDLDLGRETPLSTEAELYGEDLEALVADFTSAAVEVDTSDVTWRSIRAASDLVAGVGTLNSVLDGRSVRLGDTIESTWDDGSGTGTYTGTTRRNVVGLLGEVTVASAAGTLDKEEAPTNAVDGVAASFLLTSSTTAGYTISGFSVADDQFLREGGKTYVDSSGDIRLGDELLLTVTTAGNNTTAAVTIVSQATGTTATGEVSDSGGTGLFEFDLTAAGYGASDTLTIAHSSNLALGDTIRVRLFAAFTPPALTSELTVAGLFTGEVNLRYVIEIFTLDGDGLNGAVKIYDTTGVESTTTNSDPDSGSVPLGVLGLTFTLDDDDGYYVGQKFYVDAEAATVSTTAFSGVVLDGPAVPANTMTSYPATTLTDVKVYQRYTGVLDSSNRVGAAGSALTATAIDWDYATALGLNEVATGRTTPGLSAFADAKGKVFLSYKAVELPTATESIIELDSLTKIADELGESGAENWLGRGAIEAFKGNQNQVVYALRTGGDSVEDFAAALIKIRTTDQVYALVPMTDLPAVQVAVKDHCEAQSDKFTKNFRRCYVATDSPGAYEHWGLLPGGGYRTAELASSIVTLDSAYTDDWKFTADDVGATVTVQSLGLTFEILEVLADSEVLTDAAVGLNTGGVASGIIVTRPDTPSATASFVRGRSTSLASRRCVNVWCHNPTVDTDGTSTVLPNKFVAAEIAGLRCALLPQQGLTLTELLSVEAAPGMYATFTPEILDDIAADGTLVVSQEVAGGDIFIRHQLTTLVENGGALAYEDNVGVIVDEFAFAEKDAFRKYIGRRNATPDTISEIDDALKSIASDFTEAELVNADIGPPILAFFDEKGKEGEVTVRQDGDLADTLLTYVKLRVPLPLNGINHYIDVEVSELLSSEDN
tara:strand:- start:1385 stop:4234 length:2850 start_codon:yes stop_codon:yes gene_type:complete